jgi:hypothetical protein
MSTPFPPPPSGSPLPPPTPGGPGGPGTPISWPSSPFESAPTPNFGPVPAAGASGQYASWGQRAGGLIVRGVAIIPAYLVAAIGAGIGDAIGIIIAIVGFAYVIAVAIRLYIQRGHLGADIGDAVVGQTLVREATGVPMGSGWSVFGRNLLSFINSLPLYLGWLWPLWDAKRQTFVDKVLHTVVVQRTPPHTAGELFRNAYEVWKPVIKS